MLIPVLSGDIQIEEVCDCLREYGLVAIETTRTHAKSITAKVINGLGINEDSEDNPRLIHLATEVANGGFSDFLMYTSVYDYVPDETQQFIVKAVSNWEAAGFQDVYFANVRP